MTKRSESTAAKVRALLATGLSPKDVATQLGIKVQYVYTVRAYENTKVKRKPAKKNKPKAKKVEALVLLPKEELLRLKNEVSNLEATAKGYCDEAADNHARYVQATEKLNTFRNLTFWQRMRFAFTGRAA